MKKIIFILFLFFSAITTIAQDKDYFQYIFPKPGSRYVSKETTLLIRFHDRWPSDLVFSSLNIKVSGETSGSHGGQIIIADDQKTYIFKPFQKFLPAEKVYVEIGCDLPGFHKPLQYHFFISDFIKNGSEILQDRPGEFDPGKSLPEWETYKVMTLINGVSVPSDFPKININIFDETAEGKIFLCNWYGSPYAMILENDGTPFFYERLDHYSLDFKVQPTGTLTRYNIDHFEEFDSNYVKIKDISCGHGYDTDLHEIQLLKNGNYLLIGNDVQTIDMSRMVAGGDTNASVIGNNVLELDKNDNVIFEWRCWDHLNITDAIYEDLTASSIDYVHMNAIAIDYDNNILISCRFLSEVIKINRNNGEIIWRLGGLHNQFLFINDAYGLSYQHDIRPVPGKPNHYTVFDNGTKRNPPFSRAVEFEIDTVNMTAKKVWEYRPSEDWNSTRMGSVQVLPNGNYLINWATDYLPIAMEVTPEGEIVYQMKFIKPLECYRTFRFKWEGFALAPYLIIEPHSDKVTLIFNKFGDKNVTEYKIYGGNTPDADQLLARTPETTIDISELENHQTYFFRVTAVDSNGIESDFSNEEEIFIKFTKPRENLILNGDFSLGSLNWELATNGEAAAEGIVVDSIYNIQIDSAGTSKSDIQLQQNNISVFQSKEYTLEFDAWSYELKFFDVKIQKASEPWIDYSRIGTVYATNDKKHYLYRFIMNDPTDYSARLIFNCGQSESDLYLDNISLSFKDAETFIEPISGIPVKYKLYNN